MSRRNSRGLAVITAISLAAGLSIATVPASAAPGQPKPPGGPGLDKHDRALLAEAKADGEKRVTMLIAARPGQNAAAAEGLTDLGATVEKRDNEVDYLRVSVPISRVKQAANVAGVQAADLDEVIPLDDPRPEGTQNPTPQTPPGKRTPKVNSYMPIGETKAAQLTAKHQTWDGRGTTIGIMDTGVDLDHPALRETTTGERKITDWVTWTDPVADDDPTWVRMATEVTGPTFSHEGVTYTAPGNGSYKVGLFDERDPRLGGEVENDVNRDGNPAGSSGVFAVLVNAQGNRVWVDSDQDGSFTDEAGMTDYRERQDVGHFGTDKPGTDVKESMPFVVQTTTDNQYVNIGIVSGAHGSHVAGITAANGMFGGKMTGAAPGAKIKSVRVCLFVEGCTNHAMVEGMTWLAKTAKVDVINMSIGGLPALNDGNNTRAVLYDRLIDEYGVQIFISAGNSGAGMNTVGDPSVATKVVSVGSYISRDSWQKNYGSDSEYRDNMHGFSSRGPREDGGFKPQVVAPGSAVSTTPTWQPGGPVPGTYVLPAGYGMFNGTSMASPQAAGAAAVLVSAAQQSDVRHEPAQLRQAMLSSARFMKRYGAYEQGNGLLNTEEAWELLRRNIAPTTITSSVPVNTVLSDFLATKDEGVGIHDREGVKAGDRYERVYTFTRTAGAARARNYKLSWVGNDGTFASAATLSLAKGKAAKLPVQVRPKTAGAHSAILNVDDPTTPGVDYQTLNTVVAAEQFSADNDFTVTKEGTIGRNQTTSFFFNVPTGTPAFKVDLDGGGVAPGAGQVRFLRFHPYGTGFDSNSSTNCYTPPAGGCTTGSPTSRTVTDPQPGVWEVVIEGRRTSDAAAAPFELTASVLGATVTPNPDVVESATVGQPVSREYGISNVFGEFTGRAVGTNLGSAKRGQETITPGQQKQYPVRVGAGATSLRATIGNTSDPAADLDLYIFDCTTGSCSLAAQAADGDSEESATIQNPKEGLYVVLVDGFAVPSGSTTFDYVDVFTSPSFGKVDVTDENTTRTADATWTVPGTVTANAVPATGRVLLGAVQVRTDENVLVGTGDVVVQNVTP
ncbi:MAG TPA: S8 family serine peptidase [Marmoricola sp.]|nr:S8 family serine peptidase [Marmoricola sp.]